MRMLLFYILFVAFGCQQTTDNGQQTLSTFVAPCTDTLNVSTHIICQQTTDNGQQIKSPSHQVSESPSKGVPNNSVTWRLGDSATYYEYQIHLADSLYKNYLPQYNFDEVKAAVDFFEKSPSHQVSESPSRDDSNNSVTWRLSDSETQYLGDSVTQRLGDLNFLSARAHYYHAVGLTERDDIVGACEHYLRALVIMEIELETENLKTSKSERRLKSKDKRLKTNLKTSELKKNNSDTAYPRTVDCCPLSVDNPQDYEKLRFLALIYTRLGRLFLNENYCELATIKYRKALEYVEILGDNSSKANILKELGNSYQLSNNSDSALYYYNESLRYNSSLPNKLDVEKSIAQILFYKGERDSAYSLVRDNIDNIKDYTSRYSYYLTIGEMHFEDRQYDSAIKYLDLAMHASNEHTLLSSSNTLGTIYGIIGNKERKYYYDSISLSILNGKYNKSIDASKLQDVYRDYLDKKQEMERTRERTAYRNRIINFIMIIFFIIMVSFILIVVLRYRHRKDRKYYIDRLSEKDYEIEEKQEELEVKIKENENLNAELENIKNMSSVITEEHIIEYYNCDICKQILSEVERTENEKLKINNITCLSNDELISLEMNANSYLNGYIKNIQTKYPELKKQDIYCICLSLLNLNEPTIAVFLGKSYNAIWTRMKKIRSTLNINSDSELMHI